MIILITGLVRMSGMSGMSKWTSSVMPFRNHDLELFWMMMGISGMVGMSGMLRMSENAYVVCEPTLSHEWQGCNFLV